MHRTWGRGLHALQVMASLHGHYARMVRLDGSGAGGEGAAEVLGIKGSTVPGAQGPRPGPASSDNLRRAVHLLARADLDLRGAKAWPPGW